MKITYNTQTPFSRSSFERNVFALLEGLNSGTYLNAKGLSMESYRRIRFLPNGRLDMLSVDESARLSANTFAMLAAHMGEAPSEGEE